jgi:hypothetical protein
MTASQDKDVFAFEEFAGLRNTVDVENFEPGDLHTALNVDVTDAKKLRRRRGYGAPVFGTAAHSLWSDGDNALFMSAGSLYRLNADLTTTALRSGLGTARMQYAAIGGRVYFSNGSASGVVDSATARSWGIPMVTIQPVSAAIGGLLPAGRYQYALTFVRDDGQESGTGMASTIDLSADGGIQFSLIPVPTDTSIAEKRLYVSPPDGDRMYLQMVLPPSTEEATLTDYRHGTVALATQFLSAPPPADMLAYFNGHILVASGSRLYPSEPYAPELFDWRRAQPFASRITLVAPVEDGVYLGTEGQIIFLAGKDPASWVFQPKFSYGVIPGTLAYGDAADLGGEMKGPAAMFATADGIVAGLNGGTIVNLTSDRFRYPVTKLGAGIVRGSDGVTQYVATLQGAGTTDNTAF